MNRDLTSDHKNTDNRRAALRVLIGGILGLVAVMGIGRFVYTPILPLMQRDLGLSNSVAGYLASLNYLGYLAGAIVCSITPQILRHRTVAVCALILSLATTIFMASTTSVFWWGVMRLGGGLATVMLYIVISAEVGESLARRGYSHRFGVLYGGVGLGIALSGLLVPHLDNQWGWAGSWLGMGILATLIAAAGIVIGRRDGLFETTAVKPSSPKIGIKSLWLLIAAYFFEGLGYIVTATFIVAIVTATPGLETFAQYSWVAVGLAAIPSTILWPMFAQRFGCRKALLAAYIIQAAGILVSIGADSVIEVLFSAITFGGTFLGIVGLTLAEGSRRLKGNGGQAAAILTASFGIGQVLGPMIAGILADIQEGFTMPLIFAAFSVALGVICLCLDRHFETQKNNP